MAFVPESTKRKARKLIGTARYATANRRYFLNAMIYSDGFTSLSIDGVTARDRDELKQELANFNFTDLIYARREDKGDF